MYSASVAVLTAINLQPYIIILTSTYVGLKITVCERAEDISTG